MKKIIPRIAFLIFLSFSVHPSHATKNFFLCMISYKDTTGKDVHCFNFVQADILTNGENHPPLVQFKNKFLEGKNFEAGSFSIFCMENYVLRDQIRFIGIYVEKKTMLGSVFVDYDKMIIRPNRKKAIFSLPNLRLKLGALMTIFDRTEVWQMEELKKFQERKYEKEKCIWAINASGDVQCYSQEKLASGLQLDAFQEFFGDSIIGNTSSADNIFKPSLAKALYTIVGLLLGAGAMYYMLPIIQEGEKPNNTDAQKEDSEEEAQGKEKDSIQTRGKKITDKKNQNGSGQAMEKALAHESGKSLLRPQ